MESKDKKLSKREAINKYIDALEKQGGGKFFSKEELRRMKQALGMAVNMLTSLPDEVDPHALNIALALLVTYIAANGKDKIDDKQRQLTTIGVYINYIINSRSNPLSRVLDFMYGKEKKNEDIRVMLHEICSISKYL